MGEFTAEEEAILKRYVSNTTGNVFVLMNLPEVIKGALFSRYSRSTKSLRRLLLDEFINNPELGIQLVKENTGADDSLAVQKAEAFYDRILDGFGDDSVGELGGVHVALENISNIATKTIQDLRIGGSPLEKSSRYVWFNKKVDGDYLFLKEATIMAGEHREKYLALNRKLFETYESLIEPMKAHFTAKVPRDAGIPEQAYNFSIRARACDSLRGLLPASTLTNMGVFGNGRFFEYLLLKLRTSPLAELHAIADELQLELDKIIPSFVRRGHPEHSHFKLSELHMNQMRAVLEQHRVYDATTKQRTVDLVDYDPAAEEKVLASLLYPYSNQQLRTLRRRVREMTSEQRQALITELLAKRSNRRHKPPRAFENAYYTFDILADFGCYRDLQRHRMLTQDRQLLTVEHGYDLPAEITDAGFADKWEECMEAAANLYTELADNPYEAQYVVPFAYKVRWYFTINARGIYWLTELRSGQQGHPNYRRIAQEMYTLVKSVHPSLFSKAFVDMNDYSLGRLAAEVQKTLHG